MDKDYYSLKDLVKIITKLPLSSEIKIKSAKLIIKYDACERNCCYVKELFSEN